MMSLTQTVNTYLSMLIITIVGSAATLLIVHVANSDTLAAAFASSAMNHAAP